MAIDGFEWDAPDTPENAAEFGYAGKAAGDPDRPAFPKVRVVTVSECGSHAVVDAEIGGGVREGGREEAPARELFPPLGPAWLGPAPPQLSQPGEWRGGPGPRPPRP